MAVVAMPMPLADPLLIRVYAEALTERQEWQAAVQQTIRAILGLADAQPFVPESILSTREIRERTSAQFPLDEKLSSLIIAMREE